MGKRFVWMLCLAVSLLGAVIGIKRIDAMEFNGLRVLSKEKLERLTQGLSEVESPRNADELVQLDGHAIPYDQAHNIFYVSQPLKGREYAGTFGRTRDSCAVYLQRDGALKDKKAAIAQGYRFRIWFVTKERFAVSELVFTGLPTVCISLGEGNLSQEYEKGSIVVQNPDDQDVVTMSIKESAIKAKVNGNSGTVTFRLFKKNYGEKRELSLLGLGKHASWKLYPVYDEDQSAVREMLAVYVWNQVCMDDALQRGMEYAEVIVNREYKGLYYLAPKIGKGYLGLEEEDRVYKCEERLEDGTANYEVIGDEDTGVNREALEQYEGLWDGQNRDFTQVDADHYMNYNIYLQAACAAQNSAEEYYVIARKENGTYQFCKIPARSKFVYGLYPSDIGWQSVSAAENVVEDVGYCFMAAQEEGLLTATGRRWNDLRGNALSTDSLLQRAYLCEQRLVDSGYVGREKNYDEYVISCDSLHEMVMERMDYLDRYYGGVY